MADGAAGLRPGAVTPAIPEIDSLVEEAIARRVFPGAVVLVAVGGELRHLRAYGTTMYADPGSRPVSVDTLYDVASLTKIFTATAALRLYEAGALELAAPAAAYLPELRARDVLVQHLLTHTSGLDLRLAPLARAGREALMRAVYAAPLKCPPGTQVAYTNINSLLLGEIVARIYGAPLDEALRGLVIEPLGLRETGFCPPRHLLARIAPTERDDTWRMRLVHGSVHDESAYALGGVAGHAGLFSTAADLYRFCSAWLAGAPAEGSAGRRLVGPEAIAGAAPPRLLRPETVALATRSWTPGLNLACGLGWMLDRPNFMGDPPPRAFGHTGFTGPAIVVVPARRLIVVLLSNRVYPRRTPPHHHAVTAAVVQAAIVIGS